MAWVWSPDSGQPPPSCPPQAKLCIFKQHSPSKLVRVSALLGQSQSSLLPAEKRMKTCHPAKGEGPCAGPDEEIWCWGGCVAAFHFSGLRVDSLGVCGTEGILGASHGWQGCHPGLNCEKPLDRGSSIFEPAVSVQVPAGKATLTVSVPAIASTLCLHEAMGTLEGPNKQGLTLGNHRTRNIHWADCLVAKRLWTQVTVWGVVQPLIQA